MKILMSIILAAFITGCSWFQGEPELTSEDVCQVVCMMQMSADAACLGGGSEYWAVMDNAMSAASCMLACDENWVLFEALSPRCLMDLYIALEMGSITCPDLEICLL